MSKKIFDATKQLENDIKKIKETRNKIRNVSTKITKWSNYLFSKGITKLTDIKEYLKTQNISAQDKEASIIAAVLNCKQVEERIYLNDNLFNKKLKTQLFGNNLPIRCISDDVLQLEGIMYDIIQNDDFKAIIPYTNIAGVKITSDNYIIDNIKKGYIQDYDPMFSVICTKDVADDIVFDIIKNKEVVEFRYNGHNFYYFGNDVVSFVVPTSMSDDEIFEKFKNRKYFNTEKNKITEGQRLVSKSNKIFFLDSYIEPESFCPSYWIPPNEIIVNILFDLEFDYNLLYLIIESSQEKNDNLKFPTNMCYWDCISECFDFLAVLALTSQKLSNKNKESLMDVYERYYQLKSEINKWKTNQLLLQRILQDFINAFLNDSEYVRFVNLLNKTKKYIEIRDTLKESQDVMKFFSTLSFASMISEQFSDNILGLADRIEEVLTRYVNGTRPDGLLELIKGIAMDIYKCTLAGSTKENVRAAFPFLIPPGGLIGKQYDIENPIAEKIQKNYKTRAARKKKELKKIEEDVKMITGSREAVDKYVSSYLKRALEKVGLSENVHLRAVKTIALGKYAEDLLVREEMTREALTYANTGRLPTSNKKNELSKIIQEYINNLKKYSTYKQPKNKEKKNIEDEESMEIEEDEEELNQTFGQKRRKK